MIKTVFHVFKKQEERWSMLSRDMEYIRKTQIELLEMKTMVSQVENTLDGTKGRLQIVNSQHKL